MRRQALKILRGARELLNRRARELREQAEEAFRLVESADKAELAHGEAAAQEPAGDGEGAAAQPVAEHPAGPEEHGQQDVGQPAAAQQQPGERPGGDAAAATAAAVDGAGSGRAARPSGRSMVAAGSGRSAQTAAAAEGGRGSGGATSWRSGGAEASDGEEGEEDGTALDAPPEAEQPPDPWRFGGLAGVHLLDKAEDVRQMVGLLLGHHRSGGAGDAAAAGGVPAQQAQQAAPRHEFFGFVFDTVATGSATGAAALLPKGPTAAQRRDNAAHDKQSAGGRPARVTAGDVMLLRCTLRAPSRLICLHGGLAIYARWLHCFLHTTPPLADVGVRLEGAALSWRSGQAFYVPLNRRDDLLAELAPLFASPAVGVGFQGRRAGALGEWQ